MDITCTRPNCENPQNNFAELDDGSILKTVQQKYCSSCGMPLILDGRYLPTQLLGTGGFGAAYLACDRRTPALSKCVVKQFQPQTGLSPEQLQIAQGLFEREAEVLDRLGNQHNQIPRLLAAFPLRVSDSQSDQTNQFFYLVQEYIPGKTLEQLCKEKGRFNESEVLEMLRSVLGVLQYIHENGAIHRDLKPSNIMRHDNGTYYVLDFGTVKQVTQGVGTNLSSTSVFTAGFAPPEQISGQSIYPSTDLYALGATAVVLLTGKSNLLDLFDAYSNRWQWREQASSVSDSVAAVLTKMLEPVPSQRFQSAAEVLQALNLSQNPQPITPSTTQGIDPALSQTVVSPQRISSFPAQPTENPANIPAPRPENLSQPQGVSPSNPPYSPPSTPGQPASIPPHPRRVYPPNSDPSARLEETQVIFDRKPVSQIPPQPQISRQQNPWLKPAIAAGAALLLAGGLWALLRSCSPSTVSTSSSPNPGGKTERLSKGDQLFAVGDGTPKKEEGIKALANNDFSGAVQDFGDTLRQKPNDPESLIYLNNARIGQNQAYTIAVSVPFDSSDEGTQNAAKEILRGVAQAQNTINQADGINGVKLKVLIATDTNEEKSTEKVAQMLSQQAEVLGVIGHFSSSATQAAAEIYQKEGLVMISPTSTSTALSKLGNYIFRTVPSDSYTGKALADYMIERLKKHKAAVFFNESSGYSKSLKDVFSTDISSNGGEVVEEFNLKRPDFDAKADLAQAKKLGAEVVVLVPNSETLPQSFEVIKENRRRLPLLGGDSPYRSTTLEKGGADAQGMVLAVPWHGRTDPSAKFPKESRKLWGAEVSWRTAMAYDATEALIAALKEDPTRQGIQKALTNSNFLAKGASGPIRFLSSGDRNRPMQLVKIVPGNHPSGFEFVPLR
jgi:ABC-type branched-subunit amino acid transport system substrate-binding protein/serine/threonine protein kinase